MLETTKPKTTRSKKAAQVAALLLDTVPGVMKELRTEARRSNNGSLTLPQFRILAQLFCDSPTNNKNLAEAIGVSVAATSRMLDLLEKRGFVEKVPGKTDKREIQLRLTAKGNKHFESVRKTIQARLQDRFSLMSEAELRQVESGLQALKDTFAKIYSLPH